MDTNQTPNPAQANKHQPSSPEHQQKEKFEKEFSGMRRRHNENWFSNLFWGLFILLIGVMFLAQTLGLAEGLDWRVFVTHIWPVVIIFFGLSVMSRGGIVAGVVSAILMLLIMALLVIWFFRIPVQTKIGDRVFRLDPAALDNLRPLNGR